MATRKVNTEYKKLVSLFTAIYTRMTSAEQAKQINETVRW